MIIDLNMKLTKHFKLSEFLVSDMYGTEKLRRDFLMDPKNEQYLKELILLAKDLEEFREFNGNKSIIISSGWRSDLCNRMVGGVYNSLHKKGKAADLIIVGKTPYHVQRAAKVKWKGGIGCYKRFTHLDRGPKRTW